MCWGAVGIFCKVEKRETRNRLKKVAKQHSLVSVDPGAVAFLAKSMADENRMRVITALAAGKKSVSSLVAELAISQPLVSHHLRELKRALLVTVERRGPFVYYDLADRRVVEIVANLDALATDLLARRTTF